MYFSMKSIGFENEDKIKTLKSESDKWRFLYDIAKNYGFEGVQFDKVDTESYGLDINNIPEYFEEFKLTLHFGGHYKVMSENEYYIFNKDLSESFETALKHKMHDISIHPPVSLKLPVDGVKGFTVDEKPICEEWFDKAMTKWVREALLSNISLSVESHVYGGYFLFDGLSEYAKFIDKHPDLGVLIDISHNYFDKFSEDDVIDMLGNKNVKGFHISDALQFQDVDVRKGTHLVIGEGTINFEKLLRYFDKFNNVYGAFEIRGTNDDIDRSLKNLKKISKK